MLLAIDPGRDTGWACVEDGKLRACGLGDPRIVPFGGWGLTGVIIEKPQVYRGRSSKGDPNDLITLAIQVGRYAEHFDSRDEPVEFVIPHTWKGTVDADVLCLRAFRSLDEAERAVLVPVLEPLGSRKKSVADALASCDLQALKQALVDGRRHNVVDAVGLAKWSVKRTRAAVF